MGQQERQPSDGTTHANSETMEVMSDDEDGRKSSLMSGESSLPSDLGGRRRTIDDSNKHLLTKRWDAPIGDRGPSARFTRVTSVPTDLPRSSPSAAPPLTTRSRIKHSESRDSSSLPQLSTKNHELPPPTQGAHGNQLQRLAPDLNGLDLVGSIVERPKSKKKKSAGKQHGRALPTSLFDGHPRMNSGCAPADGFPSLHVPFGTYAGRRRTVAASPLGTNHRAVPRASASHGATSSSCSAPTALHEPIGVPTATTTSSLREAAATRDADAMLAGMSVDEIRREQDELRKVLSDDTLAFLRERRERRRRLPDPKQPTGTQLPALMASKEPGRNEDPSRNSVEDLSVVNLVSNDDATDAWTRTAALIDCPSVGNEAFENGQGSDIQRSEKERLARMLASINTFQDLDAAYEAEMTNLGTADVDENGIGGDKDDFALACDLLRSSARRQTVWAAKVVADRLRHDLNAGAHCSLREQDTSDTEPQPPWPYPVLLPVSLRCLLDASPSGTHGYVLHTYVIQSIYFLLQLRACNSHVVNLNDDSTEAVHQLYYMDDALSTPRMSACYSGAVPATLEMPGASPNASVSGAVYDTSSQSAQSDGVSFASDPMWTLLSKMRLVPRLACLLRIASRALPTEPISLSEEAILSIGGILAMLAMRSPGAAVAIAQHETLVPDFLVRSTLVLAPTDADAAAFNPKLAVPALRLLCCLVQQSRTAAEAIDIQAFLFPVLATAVDSQAEGELHRLRVWTLVLWRSLLRYGIGLDLTPTLLSLCVSHVTLGPCPTSLGPELFSALANVAKCVRVVNQRREHKAQGSPVSEETMELLFGSKVWISSTWRHALKHMENAHQSLDDDKPGARVHALRFYGSCMRFMESYIALHLVDESDANGEFITTGLGAFEEVTCVTSLSAVVKSDRFRSLLRMTMGGIFLEHAESDPTLEEHQHEAATLLFLDSLTAVVRQLWVSSGVDASGIQNTLGTNSLVSCLADSLFEELTAAVGAANPVSRPYHQAARCRSARQVRLLSAVCNLAASLKSDLHEVQTRTLFICVIGMLQCGDECRAAALISHDWLFNVGASGTRNGSILSSVLLRELCRSTYGRSQLDHSFKLLGGFGITNEGFGAFELQSLRPEVDFVHPTGDPTSDLSLPLGRLWPWHVLSGVIVAEDGNSNAPGEASSEEVAEILAATLELLVYFETSEDTFSRWYTNAVSTGVKLYHAVNVCLQPESIFQCGTIQSSLEALLDVFVGTRIDWTPEFIDACKSHSSPKTNRPFNSTLSSSPTTQDTADDSRSALNIVFDESIRALEDFVGDLCDAYIEFGAQYPSFTRCMRLFLLPCFPPAIRCLLLDKLRGIAHLLTLEGEDMSTLLSQYLPGGLPSVDNSRRESPEFVDSLCSFRSHSPCKRGETAGLVHLLTVAVVVRSLASSVIAANEAPGSLLRCQRRLAVQDRAFRIQVIQATAAFLSSSGKLSDLIKVTLSTSLDGELRKTSLSPSAIEAWVDETDWESLWMNLRACPSDKLAAVTNLIDCE